MRKPSKLDYAIKLKDGTWGLVYDGKLQKGTHPSADAAESAYSDKEGKR
jgi:hypothetical protein